MAKRKHETASDVQEIARALSDMSRLRALCALQDHELCVCQLVELLELAPSTVSKHMSVLRDAGLVRSRKQGRWVFYRLADRDASPVAGQALDWALEHMRDTDRAREDARRLEQILEVPAEELCEKQSRK